MFTHRQQREIFHLLFLERLLKIADPRAFVLKGGINLRFFFGSPRYSEDMDLDVLASAVDTLRKNGYRILQDPAFARALSTYGIDEVIGGGPAKAKHTATTQRFRARLVTAGGESLPTKVEFSRRGATGERVMGTTDPAIAQRYRRLSFPCMHYSAAAACRQKMFALATRRQPQARDAFDLHILWLGGHAKPGLAGLLTPGSIQVATTGHTRQLDTPVARYEFLRIQPSMMRQGIAASPTDPPYNLATAPKALLDTLYIATRKRRRFASLPEVNMGEVDRAELRGLVERQMPAGPIRRGVQRRLGALDTQG